MLGMILRGEAEIAVAEFTMTALRAGVVDFTVPLINTRYTALSLLLPSSFRQFFPFCFYCFFNDLDVSAPSKNINVNKEERNGISDSLLK
jgi:hypothetical protein